MLIYFFSGLPNIFGKFFPGFQNFLKFLKVHIFRSIFSSKLSLRYETVLNSIKTPNKYYKATLYTFYNKKKFDENFFFIYMIEFLSDIEI